MLTLIVVPSTDPDVEGSTELAKLSVKYLPDCEVVKPTSRNVATDPAHGKAASAGALTCIFQRPAIAVGATSLRPLLSTPASPSTGMITRIRYAAAKFLFADFTGCSLCMGISGFQRALSDWHSPDCRFDFLNGRNDRANNPHTAVGTLTLSTGCLLRTGTGVSQPWRSLFSPRTRA